MSKTKRIKKPKSFIINRARWACGDNPFEDTKLSNVSGKCCLGFYAEACGVNSRKLRAMFDPEMLYSMHNIELPELLGKCSGNSRIAYALICANDNTKNLPKTREAKITKLFKSIGVKVKFTGNYRKSWLKYWGY